MTKRLRWLVFGAAAGVAGYVWLTRKAQAAREVVPNRSRELAGSIADGAKALGTRLMDAFDEGRDAMREKEAELRAELPR